ncbi:MAG: hypothetical protein B7C24_06055 [Bacteroidetes bacterium 4572_77]|nr:MAG: hypothetical protein B7C24_06055 [Bacteroidetes bacterium 4572_77]
MLHKPAPAAFQSIQTIQHQKTAIITKDIYLRFMEYKTFKLDKTNFCSAARDYMVFNNIYIPYETVPNLLMRPCLWYTNSKSKLAEK